MNAKTLYLFKFHIQKIYKQYFNMLSRNLNISSTLVYFNDEATEPFLCFIHTLQNYGPWFDIAGAGISSVILVGLEKNSKADLSSGQWTYQV